MLFTRDVVTHHLKFNEFWPSYKEWVHHRKSTFMLSVLEPRSGSHSNVAPNLLAHIDTIEMLNNIFGENTQGCIQNDNDNNAFNIGDPMI